MDSLLTADSSALYLFFNDDVYLVNEPDLQPAEAAALVAQAPVRPLENPVPVAIAQAEAAVVPEVVSFKFLGKNKRNILILVNDEHNEVSDELGRELLRKIVKSINLSANDFALLNYAAYKDTGFKQLMDFFSSTLVFAFGVTPKQLSLSSHPEHAIVMEGTVKMIFSAELRKLDQNPAGKKALWSCLQNLGL
ncbi:hypothetical protein [Pedobacter heparinus]|uniref:hypothetical protein n=1 Tax=Pedobacter heparinus TaxID=984 RepID=UPI002931C0CD|nr:hypothetical protein [Pedobacter heparinus]